MLLATFLFKKKTAIEALMALTANLLTAGITKLWRGIKNKQEQHSANEAPRYGDKMLKSCRCCFRFCR